MTTQIREKMNDIKTTNSGAEHTPRSFSSLEEIEAYKQEVHQEVRNDEQQIAQLWKELFYKEESRMPKTPVQRVMGMVNMGSGVIDGLILGWKLYRKFKGKRR